MFNNPNNNNPNPFQFSFGNTAPSTNTDFTFGASTSNPSTFSFGNTTPSTSSPFSFGGFSQPSNTFSFGGTSTPASQLSFGASTAPSTSFGSFGSFGQTDTTSSPFSFGGTSTVTPSSTTSSVFPSPSTATPSTVASTPSAWGFGGFTSPTAGGDPLATQKFVPEPELNLTDGRTVYFQSITKQPQYQGYSFEELRTEYMNRQQQQQDSMVVNSGASSVLFGTPAAPSTGASFTTGFGFGAPAAKSEPSFGTFGTSTMGATPTFGGTTNTSASPLSFGSFDTSSSTLSFGSGQPMATGPVQPAGASWLSQTPQQPQQPTFGFTFGSGQPAAQTPAQNVFSPPAQQQPSFGFSLGTSTTPSAPTPAPSPFVFGAAPAAPTPAPTAFLTSTTAPVAMTGTVSVGSQPQATFAFDFPNTITPSVPVSNQELEYVINNPYGGQREIEEIASTNVNVDISPAPIFTPTFESTRLPPRQAMLPATFHGMLQKPKRKHKMRPPLSKRIQMFEPSEEELLWTTENPRVKTLTIYNPEVISESDEELQSVETNTSPSGSPQKATISPQEEKSPESDSQQDATGQFSFAQSSTSTAPVFPPVPNYEGLPICTREDYTTIPSIEAILKMPTIDRRHITNFTVIRKNFGEITFLGDTNVCGLNIDKIVQIEKRYVQLYDGSLYGNLPKPKRGQELNKPAIVTLYNVFPKARQRTERVARKFEQKLRDAIFQMDDAEFISYDRETGTWKFKVAHFVQ